MRCYKCNKEVKTIRHTTKVPIDSGGTPRQGQYWNCEECGTTLMTD